MENITKELQQTLLVNSDVQKVHFDAKGKHYFNIFNLQDKRDSKTYKNYGTGIYSHHQLIDSPLNVDGIREPISIGDSETEIVKTLSREEILDFKIEEKKDSVLTQVLALPKTELAALAAALGEALKGASEASPKTLPKATKAE